MLAVKGIAKEQGGHYPLGAKARLSPAIYQISGCGNFTSNRSLIDRGKYDARSTFL
jgi:hypothetical protein